MRFVCQNSSKYSTNSPQTNHRTKIKQPRKETFRGLRKMKISDKKITGKNLLFEVRPYWTIPESIYNCKNEIIISQIRHLSTVFSQKIHDFLSEIQISVP